MCKISALPVRTSESHYFSLNVIISVGYRVKSLRGTQFRIEERRRVPRQLKTTIRPLTHCALQDLSGERFAWNYRRG